MINWNSGQAALYGLEAVAAYQPERKYLRILTTLLLFYTSVCRWYQSFLLATGIEEGRDFFFNMPFSAVWSCCFFFPLNHVLVDRISFCLVQERSAFSNLVLNIPVWSSDFQSVYSLGAVFFSSIFLEALPPRALHQPLSASGWIPARSHPVSTPTPKVVSESPLVTNLGLPIGLPVRAITN